MNVPLPVLKQLHSALNQAQARLSTGADYDENNDPDYWNERGPGGKTLAALNKADDRLGPLLLAEEARIARLEALDDSMASEIETMCDTAEQIISLFVELTQGQDNTRAEQLNSLLADLMHYCDRYNICFDDCYNMAMVHYDAETNQREDEEAAARR